MAAESTVDVERLTRAVETAGRHSWAGRLGTLPLRKAWLDITHEGIGNVPTHGGVILAANHLAFIDSLLLMYGLHLLLWVLAWATGHPVLSFASGAFLIFCFVYVFPIKPLEGYDVWAEDKRLWLAIWLPILVSFFFSLPDSLAAIL